MCGRYSFAIEDELIRERFGVTVRSAIYKARYNCAPTQDLAVITNEEPDTLNFFRWGLIPFWAKDPSIGARMINARSETVLEKASFRDAFRKRRCLVPADGFFEWKRNGKKVPYHMVLKTGEPFSMAGIWDQWTGPAGQIIRSFSILTTCPNILMSAIHDRMPVILRPEDEKSWLGPLPETDLSGFLKPFPDGLMKAFPVPSLVNSPRNDSPGIVVPAGPEMD